MSTLSRALSSARITLARVIHIRLRHLCAGTLVLAIAVLTSSCAMLENSAGQNSGNSSQTLTVTGNFPEGVTHQAYNTVLTVSGGNPPYQFAIQSGTLPPGMTLNAGTGSVSGTPTAVGSYAFEVGVTDAPAPHRGNQRFALSITDGNKTGIRVTVSPSSTNVVSNQTQSFTASVTGTENTGVNWAATAGSITTAGLFTAPSVSSVTTVYVTATSKADSKQQGAATVMVEPATNKPLSITSDGLPEGHTGNVYSAGFAAAGGTQPYKWSVSAGLPPGITLTAGDGELSGTPSSPGAYNFTVKVTDAKSQAAQKAFAINVSSTGNFDGPAELPRAIVSTSMADTPAPGSVIPVSAGADLQAALNNAHCGDIVELQAGATFTGTFTLPAKSCDNGHWIIIRSSAPDSALPAEGQRVNPCYAGVASLQGRPQYSCSNPKNVMARIEYPKTADGPITLKNGANHYRLIGLEITKTVGVKSAPTLIAVEADGVADHIIIDRSWLHGTTHEETKMGITLTGMNYVGVVDSYFTDFHCTAGTGTCTDSHAVGGGLGNHQDGPFKIENNLLEAAAEAVFFGGGAATKTPADITIRRNHFFKPWQWMPNSPGFVGANDGHPFIVKNHFELKNAMRVLVEASLMENNWGGFTQGGYAIGLGPKNPITRSGRLVCPTCQVTDITIRYVHVAHSGAGIVMATAISGSGGNGGAALAGTRWSIHDVVVEDINKNYTGSGTLFEFQNRWPKNPLNTISVNHVTAFPDPDSHLMTLGNLTTLPPMYGLIFTNNIVMTGQYPVWGTGGGAEGCGNKGTPEWKISNCFTTYTFNNNALVATPKVDPPSEWPSPNFFPSDPNAVGFVQYKQGGGGDYRLQSGSPYKNAGTDGRDLGADIVGLQAALAGVE